MSPFRIQKVAFKPQKVLNVHFPTFLLSYYLRIRYLDIIY